jgi:predicted nucleic acid-binding protein
MNKFAVDTNLFIYLHDTGSPEKQKQAIELIKLSPIVSTQVISEYLNVTKRLFKYPQTKNFGNMFG